MNRYEEKLEARRERLLERAAKHRSISEASFKRVHRIADNIPFGQPILVGHHSERHHRADINRIDNGMRKGIDEGKYADDLESRAESVGTAGIATEDPDAVVKLKEKIAAAEGVQSRMKAANAIIHKKPKNLATPEKLLALVSAGFSSVQASELFKPDFCGRIGFAAYQFQNNGANIRRMKERVEYVSKLQATPAEEIEGANGIRYEDAPEENRVRLFFPGKPSDEVRTDLKRSGFRWAPSLGCWQAFRRWSTIDKAKSYVKSGE